MVKKTDTGRGGITPQGGIMGKRFNKTVNGFNWERGYYTDRALTHSFPTLEAAQKFAKGKDVRDIYRNKGKYVVEWVKHIDRN